MVEMAQFICSNHAAGPHESYVSKDLIGLGKPIPMCPECGERMIYNGIKEMN